MSENVSICNRAGGGLAGRCFVVPFRAMSKPEHIVVVDDDPDIRDELDEYLTRHGYRVSLAEDGAALRRVIEEGPADLILLDLTMPGGHGLALVGDIRQSSNAGIIILTGTGDAVDQVVGLELGADDYVSKPCDLRALLARIRSVLRRSGGDTAGKPSEIAEFAGWRFDFAARRLAGRDGGEVELTTAEFDLLRVFIERAGRVQNRDQLLDSTQGRDWSPFDRSIDNLISRLRRKIEADPAKPQLIKTVRGAGYVFTPKVTRR